MLEMSKFPDRPSTIPIPTYGDCQCPTTAPRASIPGTCVRHHENSTWFNLEKHPAGLEMGRVKTAFSCYWQEVNHAFRSVFSCFYVVHEGQFYCDFEFSLGFTVYS